MELPIIIGVIVLLVIVLISIAALRRGSGVIHHGALPGGIAVPPVPPQLSETQLAAVQADPQLRRHMGANRKLDGIKRIRELTNLGLKESKDLYEVFERSGLHAGAGVAPAVAPPVSPGSLSEADLQEVHAMIAANQKIQAIKLVRERTGMGLKEAKDYVEALESGS